MPVTTINSESSDSGFGIPFPVILSSLFTSSSVLLVIGEVEEAAVRVVDAVVGQFSSLVLLVAEVVAVVQAAVLVVSVAVVPAVEAEQAEVGKGIVITDGMHRQHLVHAVRF